MARLVRDAKLETREARRRLPARHNPYWRSLHRGLAIGYRKGPRGGMWLARKLEGTRYLKTMLGKADDHADADGGVLLDYKQAYAAALNFAASAQAVRLSHNPTVKDVLDYYLIDQRARAKRADDMERAINAHILPAFGERRISDLTTASLRRWHQALAEAPPRRRKKKVISDAKQPAAAPQQQPVDPEVLRKRRSTANRILTIFKAALNHAYEDEQITGADTWRRVKPFRDVDHPKIRFITEAEAKALLDACPVDFRTLVRAALLTGCRYGELIALRVRDVDLENGSLFVAQSKSGKPRHVPLTAEGVVLFRLAAANKRKNDLLLTRGDGEAWGKSHQQRRLHAACQAAKISPAIAFHDLRHSYASALARAGVPLMVISAALGHSDTRMTQRHYAHLTADHVGDTIRAHLPAFGDSSLKIASRDGATVND